MHAQPVCACVQKSGQHGEATKMMWQQEEMERVKEMDYQIVEMKVIIL